MDPASNTSAGLSFGRFLLWPQRRELLVDNQPVKLGGRAFDVLLALIAARGAVLSTDALLARVWGGRIVEENALRSQVSELRAALGADRNLIRTVSGRGYQFTGEIRTVPAVAMEPAGGHSVEPAARSAATNLPEPVSELIGRADDLREILSLAGAHQLVTLTGAGGIGKTRLALAAARQLRSRFADGVWLAELSALADPGLSPPRWPRRSGSNSAPATSLAQRLAQALAERRLLIVLDTCEHVIGSAAALAEAVLQVGRAVHLLATSRERLDLWPGSPRSVDASTGCRWRSRWQRRGPRCSLLTRSRPGSTIASGC